MTQVTVNSNTYSDNGEAARDMRNGGHRSWLLPMIADTMVSVSGASTSASNAATSASNAATSATNAQNYAAALQATSTTSYSIATGSKLFNVGSGKQFATGQRVMLVHSTTPTNWVYGDVTSYSGTDLTVNITQTGGSGTVASWNVFLSAIQGPTGATGATGAFSLTYAAKTTTTSVGAADKAYLIDATTGTWTMTFAAPATLGAGWWSYIRNSGTGVITLAHTSGNIDGLTGYPLLPNEVRIVQCNGSTLRTLVVVPFFNVTGSTAFGMPPGYRALGFDLVGAGGSGANGGRAASATVYGGCGGGGGARYLGQVAPPTAGTTVTVTVGSGGVAKSGRTTDGASESGNDGSNTTIAWSSVTRALAGGGTGGPASGDSAGGGGVNGAAEWSGGGYGGIARSTTATTGRCGEWAGGSGAPRAGGGTGYGSVFGGGGGGRGGTQDGTNRGGGAGGAMGAYAQGTGSAGGAAAANAGAATNSGGGGGGSNNAGVGGNGADGNGAGCGGGGGGSVVGAYTSGSGGAGANGSATVWGLL